MNKFKYFFLACKNQKLPLTVSVFKSIENKLHITTEVFYKQDKSVVSLICFKLKFYDNKMSVQQLSVNIK